MAAASCRSDAGWNGKGWLPGEAHADCAGTVLFKTEVQQPAWRNVGPVCMARQIMRGKQSGTDGERAFSIARFSKVGASRFWHLGR